MQPNQNNPIKPHTIMLAALACLSIIFSPAYGLDDGLAQTPPMGWNSWNTFRLEINEELVRGIADMFVERGFKDAGYEYIVIDDG